MQLYFIRHAQSANNALWANTGSSRGRSEDPELTGLGLQQAWRLAQTLREGDPKSTNPAEQGDGIGFGITHLYTSLMLRAVQTGAIVAEALGLPFMALGELHEIGGIYLEDEQTGEVICLPGKDRAYFETHFPDCILPPDFVDTGWWDRRPREEYEQSLERARRLLQILREKHPGPQDRVAVISHGGFYNNLLFDILPLAERDGLWFTLYNAAITRIDFQEDLTELVYQNRVDHLPGEMIT